MIQVVCLPAVKPVVRAFPVAVRQTVPEAVKMTARAAVPMADPPMQETDSLVQIQTAQTPHMQRQSLCGAS